MDTSEFGLHQLVDGRHDRGPPVLSADVCPLAVFGGGVMHLEEYLEQLGGGHLGRVVLYVDGFGMSRVPRANLG